MCRGLPEIIEANKMNMNNPLLKSVALAACLSLRRETKGPTLGGKMVSKWMIARGEMSMKKVHLVNAISARS